MAITKLGHMKESSRGNPGRHLQNAIEYIMNPEKTEHRLLVGGNSGSAPAEVYQTFLDTKMDYGKLYGRQGYHFVISFKPGEVSLEQLHELTQRWCNTYLGDDYDYVYALHNDQAHLHSHIIFNSVSRTTGYKYRYENGDWEKNIQPVTDQLCQELNLPMLAYEKENPKGKHYAEHSAEKKGKATDKDVLLADIDAAINKALDYADFLENMKDMGYGITEGYSKKMQRAFLYFKSDEMKYARKSYRLGMGYDLQDIKGRIEKRHMEPMHQEKRNNSAPKVKSMQDFSSGISIPQDSRHSGRTIHYMKGIQVWYVRRTYLAAHIRNPYAVRDRQYRKDIRRVEQLAENCRFLMRNQITNRRELEESLSGMKKVQKEMYQNQDIQAAKEMARQIRIAYRISRELNQDKKEMVTENRKKDNVRKNKYETRRNQQLR